MSAHAQPHETVLTRAGYDALNDELAALTRRGRVRIVDELQQARSVSNGFGADLELLEARREQERLEARIAVLETLLRDARVVEEAETVPGVVGVGSEVEVEDLAGGTPEVFLLVGSPEVAPAENRVSVESPVGRALAGRRRGDVVDVDTPKGHRRLHVVRVRSPRRNGLAPTAPLERAGAHPRRNGRRGGPA